MGTWGTGLYEMDCTVDIKDSYFELLSNGMSPQTAASKIRKLFQSMFDDPDDGPLVELALQEQLFQSGAIKENDRLAMIVYLQKGADLPRWMLENPTSATKRQAEIQRLEMLFSSPLPKTPIKGGKKCKANFNWCEGQVFALPITKHDGFNGEYILLHVCGKGKKEGRYQVPKMRVKLTQGGTLPQNEIEFNNIAYLQVGSTAMEFRMGPFSRLEDIPKEFQQQYCPDKWGNLPEYTITLHEYSDIHPPQSMIYLGRWMGIKAPEYEYIKYPFPFGVAWDYIEDFAIDRYSFYKSL